MAPVQVLGHAIDITERITAEQTLRRNEQTLRLAQAELEERVRERTEALEFLANFSEQLAPVVAFEQLIDVVHGLTMPFLADAASVHAVDEDGSVRLAHAAGAVADDLTPVLTGRLARVIATDAVEIIGTQDLAAVAGPAIGSSPIRAVAMLPLSMEGRVKAVVTLFSKEDRGFSGSSSLVLDDVVRRLRLALDRIHLYRTVEDANRLKDEFLSTLSHELRTPLNAIYGWAQILRNRSLDESSAHAVAVIQRNAEAQIRLIEEVLDVSRIITGKMAMATEVVDLAAVVAATIDVVRPALQAKRIRFVERLGVVPPVLGDGHRLQQAFWNVLSNALKFTGHDGEISVTLRPQSKSVAFEVADTGVGIRRDVLPFVFDRFRQADSSMSRSHSGLGLGLAIVRHIVELHGGTVRAASAGEGQGATFTIHLPIVEGAGALAPITDTAPSREPVAGPRLNGRIILVVEDHADARELVAAVLESAGALVLVASSAEEAMDAVRQVRPDMLVTDLGLPGQDGYGLLRRFQALYPNVPAIALTAYARASDRERALAHGFDRYLIKPIEPNELVSEIASVWRKPS
jgi:signal transduction histidine kinase/CheY-like chemotaxis protein